MYESRRLRRAVRWAGSLGLVLACGGTPTPNQAVHRDDLLFDGRWRFTTTAGSATRNEPAELPCADETHLALALTPGTVLETRIELGGTPRLMVSACVEPGGPQADLEVEVEGQPTSWSRPDPAWHDGGAWWWRTVDLGRSNARSARVRLHVTGDPQARLLLRDVVLEHRVPVPTRPTPAPPQVLLISIDTLRPDAIAALGGPWPTPHLDRLVADGQAFSESYAAATWTKPSHGTMLTGLAPLVHGAARQASGLQPAATTLAERLTGAGFATAGLVHDIVHLDPRFGFDRGFDEYQVTHWSLGRKIRHAGRWLSAHRDRRSFFFLHSFETHSDFHRLPYESPGVDQAAVDARFGTRGYGCDESCASIRLARIKRDELAPIADEAAILRYLYGQTVRHVDREIGRLVDRLIELGLYDDLMIVLTSDHGELLFEHDTVLHGVQWQEVARVPLVIKWPHGQRAGTRSDLRVSGQDIAPTVLAAAGLDPADLPGADLATLEGPDRPILVGTHSRSLIVGRLKLIFDRDGETDRYLLFDLVDDPEERHDLAAARPADVERLRRALERRLRADRARHQALAHSTAGAPEGLTDEERARLRALGYLDGS